MRGDEDSLEEPVRVPAQIVTVLERAGLAFVGIDAEIAWPGLAADDVPLPAGRKAGPAQTAQTGIVEGRQQVDGRTGLHGGGCRAGDAVIELVAARGAVTVEVDGLGQARVEVARRDHARTASAVAGSTRRCPTMTAGAWLHAPMQGARTTRTAVGSAAASQLRQQPLGPEHGAAQAVADADRQRRRWGLTPFTTSK